MLVCFRFNLVKPCGQRELAITSSSSQHGSPAEHNVLCPGLEMGHFKQVKRVFKKNVLIFKSVHC